MKRAWWINLDGDDELATTGAPPTPSVAMRQRRETLIRRIGPLLPEGDVVIVPGARDVADSNVSGRAWLPTPSALAALRRYGAALPEAPSIAVLRAVNHRQFASRLGNSLPGAAYVTSEGDVENIVRRKAPFSRYWVLKRPFGYAGRGRLRIRDASPTESEWRWVVAALRADGGIQVEPWVERCGDFALHGFIARSGAVELGEPTEQKCTEQGVWLESNRASAAALSTTEVKALRDACESSADAMKAAGYFGPFGIDAYRWKRDGDAIEFNERCEINGRYTMGWAIGMGEKRPDL